MTISVTSWFYEQLASQACSPQIRFTIGSSDYTGYVKRWPTIKRDWDDAKSQSVSITLADDNNKFNFIRNDKTKMLSTCTIKVGFTHPSSGDELLTIFSGKMSNVKYSDGQCRITISDKFKQLSERIMGTKDSPVTFTNSTLPSDIAWTAMTTYGGLSSVASTSNPDIDYASWNSWDNQFNTDAVYMNANVEGLKVSEMLNRIARHTLSAIYIDQDRITFKRFTLVDSASLTLSSEILDIDINIDGDDIINKQYVYGSYVPSSDDWGIQVYSQLTSSVNSYGLHEEVEKDDAIWYIGSGAALNLAQRITKTAGEPYDRVEISSTLVALSQQIGENILLVDSFYAINAGYRLMGYSFNLQEGIFKGRIDQSQYVNPFILDVSTLDGPDVLV